MRRTILMLAAALLAVGCAQVRPTAAPTPTTPTPEPVTAAPAVFHGLGRLAATHYGRLSVIDGETNTIRELADKAYAPAWSADGRWLAVGQADSEYDVVDTATWQEHELTGIPGPITALAWAPRGHTLAAATADAIWLLEDPVSGPARRLTTVAAKTPGQLLWAPDSSQIAYITPGENRNELLNVVRVSDGKTAPWYTAAGSGIELAGWRPDSGGLLFWVRPGHCNSCAVDGLPLLALAAGAKAPVTLPATLLHRNWLTWIGDELLLVRGSGRIAWDDKQLARCNVTTGACRDLPQPETVVTLDPAQAPDGSRIAVVRAERRPGKWGFDSQDQVNAWQETRRLWLISPDGKAGRELTAAGTFISNPTWAADSRHLLYVADATLRIIDVETGESQPLLKLGGESPQGYYGQIDYSRQFAFYHP